MVFAVGACKPIEKQVPEINLPLPKNADGVYDLLEVAGSTLQIDPTLSDPITAVGRCADLITACYEGSAPLDSCVSATRRCATKEPWKEDEDCCPDACVAAYEKERKTNADPLASFEKVFFLEPGCFPGVVAALGSTP